MDIPEHAKNRDITLALALLHQGLYEMCSLEPALAFALSYHTSVPLSRTQTSPEIRLPASAGTSLTIRLTLLSSRDSVIL